MKADKAFYKRAFWILWVIAVIGILSLGMTAYHYQSESEDIKISSIELMKIMLEAQAACIDYANLTIDEFQEVFFEWGVEKIRNENKDAIVGVNEA